MGPLPRRLNLYESLQLAKQTSKISSLLPDREQAMRRRIRMQEIAGERGTGHSPEGRGILHEDA
ncbi:hypothetical protein KCP74_02835 [Salmonella enterica subsp. enterica]|nr:hypothetical protein KCP74_02835 [Salmonella enterica subsp. enterica]